MWRYLSELLERLNRQGDTDCVSDRSLVEQVFPGPRLVWVWREDVAAQAASWAKAIQTGY